MVVLLEALKLGWVEKRLFLVTIDISFFLHLTSDNWKHGFSGLAESADP